MDEVPGRLEVVERGYVVDADVRVQRVAEEIGQQLVLGRDLGLLVLLVGKDSSVART